jgi:hypothetical protein
MTVVVSGCSMIAGPASLAPGEMRPRSKIGVDWNPAGAK